MKFIPHMYQDFAIEKMLDEPAAGLFLEMGLGKTVITLTAVEKMLFDTFDAHRVLIVAPKRVAEDTWSRESEKWDHTKDLRISKILGSVKQREAALKATADVYIINRENVPWLVGMFGSKWPFDTVIIDELSSFKSSSSQRFRALRKVRPLIKRVYGLTGTPAPNGLLDLWPQLYLLDQGERLGNTVGAYRDRFFNASPNYAAPNPHAMKYTAKPETENAVFRRIGDICISMKSEDWLELKEPIFRTVPVVLDKKARADYEKLEEDMLLPFMGGDVVANSAAVLSNKLLQLANGAVYDEGKQERHIHDGKLDALEDLYEAANGNPLLVFYTYKHDLRRIKERFPEARELKTSQDIADWNAGKIPIFLAHPASAGHGLNLQDGGNQVVWFGLTWSLELYQQANARLQRQGQAKQVIIHHIVTEDTMDEDVIKRLSDKAEGQEALIQAVKARIAKVAKK